MFNEDEKALIKREGIGSSADWSWWWKQSGARALGLARDEFLQKGAPGPSVIQEGRRQ